MPLSGFFITLFDEETLSLYLDRGVYGFHMGLETSLTPSRQHLRALGDYSCARHGTHVFFFLKRHVYYGGQLTGSADYGAFYLNGPHSPLGSRTKSPIVWDESHRAIYQPSTAPGTFVRPKLKPPANTAPVCQPYLVLFRDRLGLKGKAIPTDDLYFRLGDYGYPLPTNTIKKMGFCTMTPAEVRIALELLEKSPIEGEVTGSNEKIELTGDPVPFSPKYGIADMMSAESEAHLEESILANPRLLPAELFPKDATLCRQVPVSPINPDRLDRADICYYSEDSIADGSIPNKIIELKMGNADPASIRQVLKYKRWLDRRIPNESRRVSYVLLTRSYNPKRAKIPAGDQSQFRIIPYGMNVSIVQQPLS